MSYRDGVAIGEDGQDTRVDWRVFRMHTLTVPGAGDVSNNLLAPTWRQRSLREQWFPHAVLLVQAPLVTGVSGDSQPSAKNWLYATPSEVPDHESHLSYSDGTADHYGAHIVAYRSDGGVLFLPHGGKWDIYYPDTGTSVWIVLDGRNPTFVRWASERFACYHALSYHPNDITVPFYDGTAPSVVTVAVASRWRRRLILQNVGPTPDTTPAAVATDPPIRVWTTTAPTSTRGIILYPRDKLVLPFDGDRTMVANQWQATAIGAAPGSTKLSVQAWV